MAKLVLSSGGNVLHQYFIEKERMTVGRDPHNEVIIDDAAVSREHAAIITVGKDQIVEDLQSSNGTFINGERISRQILKHGDVIELGPYSLRYLNPKLAAEVNLEHTMLIDSLPGSRQQESTVMRGEVSGTSSRPLKVRFPKGSVKVLYGPRAPNTIPLDRVVATFGKPGKQLAVITRRPMGYFVTHVEGSPYPRVNGQAIGKEPQALKDHDVIEVADDTLEFFLHPET